jgi:hypothetical protein
LFTMKNIRELELRLRIRFPKEGSGGGRRYRIFVSSSTFSPCCEMRYEQCWCDLKRE